MNDDDLNKLRDLIAKATPGPWKWRDDAWHDGLYADEDNVIGAAPIGYDNSHVCIGDSDAAFVAAAREAVPALITEVERLRDLVRQLSVGIQRGGPVKISLPPSQAKDWVIKDIQVRSVFVPPPTDEDRRREAESALRHDPRIARTIMEGPGNHRKIIGCACNAPGVSDTASWAAHVGVPGAATYLKTIFALQDAAEDAIAYPGKETLARLAGVLRREGVVAPNAPKAER